MAIRSEPITWVYFQDLGVPHHLSFLTNFSPMETLLAGRNSRHSSTSRDRYQLPIYKFRSTILNALEKYKTLVLVGETGSGKSTQLPQFCAESGWAQSGFSIVCTQPKQIAVLAVAQRVAQEIGCRVGDEVGYAVRHDFRCSARTQIRFYEDHVLLRESISDPFLTRYSVIIVDEAHRRSIQTDLLLGLLKKIRTKRSDLRIIITSATLDATLMKNFFESNEDHDTNPEADDTCVLAIHGRQHPVDVLYLEKPCRDYISETVRTILAVHRHEQAGDMLVFLPRSEDIDYVRRALLDAIDEVASQEHAKLSQMRTKYASSLSSAFATQEMHFLLNLFILPLHGTMPLQQQLAVLEPAPPHRRKVVLSTQVAEAGITIDGIRFVVDCGYVTLPFFDVTSGITVQCTVVETAAMAVQRCGRAGRTAPGKCLRLAPESAFREHVLRPKVQNEASIDPDMVRCDLTATVLQMLAIGIRDVVHFDYLSPPSPNQLIYALEVLYSLQAIDSQGKLTEFGQSMAELPVEPRMARCLLVSAEPRFRVESEMLSIAAMLAVDHPFTPQPGSNSSARQQRENETLAEQRRKWEKDRRRFLVSGSDHLTLLRIYEEFTANNHQSSWCDANSLLPRVLQRARDVRAQLDTALRRVRQSEEETARRFSSGSASGGAVTASAAVAAGVGSSNNDNDEHDHIISTASTTESTLPLDKRIRRCLVTGFFSQVAQLSREGLYRSIRGGRLLQPHPRFSSVAREALVSPEWIIFHDVLTPEYQHHQSGQQQHHQRQQQQQNRHQHKRQRRDQHNEELTPPMDADSVLWLKEVSSIEPLWLSELASQYYDLQFDRY